MHHLTIRVPWHDNQWNGTVCTAPSGNPYCITLERIRKDRDEVKEIGLASRIWSELGPGDLPPCIAESAGFMSDREWRRTFMHAYQSNPKTVATHGHLRPTIIKVPPYSTFAVPFAWMLAENSSRLEATLPEPLPPDEQAPFSTPWIFGRERQEAISNLVFGRLTPPHSLVFFYTKEGHPLGENISRLVVGVGRILQVGSLQYYQTAGPRTYPFWDRLIQHSIRPEGHDGFLLPYHDYLTPTGDAAEDAHRQELLKEIAVAVDPAYIRTFSYAGELANSDVALSTLARCLKVVRKIRQHGIAGGHWERQEEWLNQQIAAAWKDRGAFPGLGSAMEALKMRLGTALTLEMIQSKIINPEADPWPVVDALFRGTVLPPTPAYAADLAAAGPVWLSLSDERRTLLKLLSRFALTPAQASRWFNENERADGAQTTISDVEILANPYRIAETDLGDGNEPPVSVDVIDRGMLPDNVIAARHPVPAPSAIGSPNDPRRIRAALVSLLRRAAEDGDTLLSTAEALERLATLNLSQPCLVGSDWIPAHRTALEGAIEAVDVLVKGKEEHPVQALQLNELKQREEMLRKRLEARARVPVAPATVDWQALLITAINETGGRFEPGNERHKAALQEQEEALQRITTRRLSVLIGRAGTGKTSVLGALFHCKQVADNGILLLAPTGKARVRLAKAAKTEAMTIAQFLYSLERYDGKRQRPLFMGKRYSKERTVVIDESSMLTVDDLAAVMEALDLGEVKRLILVGDPNQLPPIGAGRPFADLVAHLEKAAESPDPEIQKLAGAIGRLTVEVRASAGTPSVTLRLASWFTREPQPVDADSVLSDLESGSSFNDLDTCYWQTPEELHERLLEQFQKHLGLTSRNDIAGFDRAMGLNEKRWVPFEAPDGVEHFQILSPVRMSPYGIHSLNRWVQWQFRGEELKDSRQFIWEISLGDEEIVLRDKVIQVRNSRRSAYDGTNNVKEYLANGEIGTVATHKGKYLNVVFAGRPGLTFGYSGKDFHDGSGPLELAYALTIHKAQGSEFGVVFVILPKNTRLLSRELLYTALTRSRDRLVLLLEGKDASFLYDYSLPEKSETARRNTNLFQGAIRERADEVPYVEYLIHRTQKGQLVRSKSELVIANTLEQLDIPYQYERPLNGEVVPGRRRPDFSFTDAGGSLILWEHLGMLKHPVYRAGWDEKRAWYEKNGFALNTNLFTTEDDERGGLDSMVVKTLAEKIQRLL